MGTYPSARLGSEISVDDRRRQVLDAAIRSIAVNGYESVRLRDIAREAGVSTGLIQHYFENRDALLQEMFRYACQELLGRWIHEAAAADSAGERLGALFDRVTDAGRAATWTEFASATVRHVGLREPFKDIYHQWQSVLEQVISEGIAAGEFDPALSIPDVASILIAYTDGALLALASSADVTDTEQVRRRWRALTQALLDSRQAD